MAFCKICICGEKILFERRLSFPDFCPSCGRRLMELQTYDEADPEVENLMKNRKDIQETKDTGDVVSKSTQEKKVKKYFLKLQCNGKEIALPDEGCIIGRTETGALELAEYASVSRQHLKVTIRRNIGVLVEDISSYGTLVDGQRIVKNTPVRVADGSKVTLCNVETVLMVKEVNA